MNEISQTPIIGLLLPIVVIFIYFCLRPKYFNPSLGKCNNVADVLVTTPSREGRSATSQLEKFAEFCIKFYIK